MEKVIISLLVLMPKWELLLEQPICLGNDTEKHITRNSCNIDICSWEKDKTVLVFVTCNNEEVVCNAYDNGKLKECDQYENKVKF